MAFDRRRQGPQAARPAAAELAVTTASARDDTTPTRAVTRLDRQRRSGAESAQSHPRSASQTARTPAGTAGDITTDKPCLGKRTNDDDLPTNFQVHAVAALRRRADAGRDYAPAGRDAGYIRPDWQYGKHPRQAGPTHRDGALGGHSRPGVERRPGRRFV